MKRQYMLFVIVLLFCTNTSAQQKEYSGKIHVTALSLQQEGDSVYVKLSYFRGKRRFTSFDQPDSHSGSGRRQTGPARSSRQRT